MPIILVVQTWLFSQVFWYNRYIKARGTMVNYEIKSQLAKLLATEDIIVENKNVETAS